METTGPVMFACAIATAGNRMWRWKLLIECDAKGRVVMVVGRGTEPQMERRGACGHVPHLQQTIAVRTGRTCDKNDFLSLVSQVNYENFKTENVFSVRHHINHGLSVN